MAGDRPGYNEAVRPLVAGLCALTACGRIGFDERRDARDGATDAPRDTDLSLGHDEDGDGIPDASDPCPQLAGTAVDTDGDGVGDDCDVNRDEASERWLGFWTMQAGDQPFDDLTGFTQEGDALRTTTDVSPTIPIDLTNARIEVGWEIHGVLGTGQHQLAYGLDSTTMANSEYYFIELNESGDIHDAALVSYDQANGYQTLAAMDPGALHPGTGFSRVDVADTTPGTMAVRMGWPPDEVFAFGAATPGFVSSDHTRFSIHGLDVSIRYVAITSTTTEASRGR